MSTSKEQELFKQRLSALQETANYYFSKAQTEKERMIVIERMGDVIRDLSLSVRKDLGGGCPPGYTLCPDGSCVPYGMNCK